MKPVLDQLITLLAQERAALRGGDQARLGHLAGKKKRLIDRLEAGFSGLAAADVERLRSEAEKTARALRAALDGMAQAVEQVRALRHRDDRVYRQDGTRNPLGQTHQRMARKA